MGLPHRFGPVSMDKGQCAVGVPVEVETVVAVDFFVYGLSINRANTESAGAEQCVTADETRYCQ